MVQTAVRTESPPTETDTGVGPKDARAERSNPATPAFVSHDDMIDFTKRHQATPKENVVQNGKLNLEGGPKEVASLVATKGDSAAAASGDVAKIGPIETGTAPTGDRSPTISDSSGPGVNQADIQTQKTRLEQLTQGMNADQAAEAKKDMAAIEHRKPPLNADQINSIYDSTSKLLENKAGKSPLSESERAQLAAGILHNASLRHEIDQGHHNTCNVTTLEERLNLSNPAEAARIVSEVGLTGQYKSKDKQIIKLDEKSLHADGEAQLSFGDPRCDGKRDYASQVFDMATINDYWQHQQPPLRYSQVPTDGQSDSGERLTYANGKEVAAPDGRPMRQPGLSAEAMGQIGKSLGMDGHYIITNEKAGGSTGEGTKSVQSYDDFKKALSNGEFSSIVKVNTNDQLFGGDGNPGGPGGWHVVSVSDYKDGPPPQVLMTNQWGEKNNKWVNVSDIYNATIPPGADGRVDVAGNRLDGKADKQQPASHGQGQDGSHRQGQGQGGSKHQGWSRNDGVIPDDEYKHWRQELHKHWKDSHANPLKHNSKATIDERVKPLQKKLEEAAAREDELQKQIIEAEIEQIKLSVHN
jgi:hypothetical protein